MSIASLISDIKSKIFGTDKQKLEKIYPKFDNEFIPDLEAGEGGFNRRLRQRQLDLDLYSKPKNWDPEKCEKLITCEKGVNAYENSEILENYMSFIDVVNYFVIHKKQRSSSVGFISEIISSYEEQLSVNLGIEIIKDEPIDMQSYLCSDNVI
jgi:hypothetical protein